MQTDEQRKERQRAYAKQYYEMHKNDPDWNEKTKKAQKAMRERNKENPEWLAKQAASQKKWYENNQDKVKENSRRQYKRTVESGESLLYPSNWRKNNPEKHMLRCSKTRAKKMGMEFNLSLEDIVIPTHCPLLGIELVNNLGSNNGRQENSPSLDRIDSSKGYIKGNVWVVSWRANRIKNNASTSELELIVNKLKSIGIK